MSRSQEAWGAEISLLLIAREMTRAGVEVELLAQAPSFVQDWPTSRAVCRRGPPFYWQLAVLACRREVGALVCCSIHLMPAVALLRLLPRRYRPTLVLDLHYRLPTRAGRRRLRWFAICFDRIVAVSRYAASQLGGRTRGVQVLFRPVDEEGVATTPVRPASNDGGRRRPLVGVVGRLDPDKHLELVIAAAELLPEVDIEFRGASSESADYERDLRALAARRLGTRAHFAGRVPAEAVLVDLDCLIVANREETMGRTVVEAQLCRVPVVVPDQGGSAELVDDGRTGLTYAAGDAQALAEAIRAVVGAPARAAEMVEAAHEQAARRHDPAAVAAAYAAFALAGSSARVPVGTAGS